MSRIELTLQGRADIEVIKTLTSKYELRENQEWFFVDYAITDIPLTTKFDLLFEGLIKNLVREYIEIGILLCIDEFRTEFDPIPRGYKTICKLDFSDHIPLSITQLPKLSGWKYNPNAITLANQKDIRLWQDDPTIIDLYNIAYSITKEYLILYNIQSVKRDSFISFIESHFKINSKSASNIVDTFLQMGKLKVRNDEIVLAESA